MTSSKPFVCHYNCFPHRGTPVPPLLPPPPLFLIPTPRPSPTPLLAPLPLRFAPSGVSHITSHPSVGPVGETPNLPGPICGVGATPGFVAAAAFVVATAFVATAAFVRRSWSLWTLGVMPLEVPVLGVLVFGVLTHGVLVLILLDGQGRSSSRKSCNSRISRNGHRSSRRGRRRSRSSCRSSRSSHSSRNGRHHCLCLYFSFLVCLTHPLTDNLLLPHYLSQSMVPCFLSWSRLRLIFLLLRSSLLLCLLTRLLTLTTWSIIPLMLAYVSRSR
ncbi:unnamed protein product [Closterium sp. NIES-54]